METQTNRVYGFGLGTSGELGNKLRQVKSI